MYCTVPRQLRKYAQLTRAMHPNTLFVRPVFNRSRPDGSSALACRVVPRRLSYSDVGTRFIVADSIRNLGQEERALESWPETPILPKSALFGRRDSM